MKKNNLNPEWKGFLETSFNKFVIDLNRYSRVNKESVFLNNSFELGKLLEIIKQSGSTRNDVFDYYLPFDPVLTGSEVIQSEDSLLWSDFVYYLRRTIDKDLFHQSSYYRFGEPRNQVITDLRAYSAVGHNKLDIDESAASVFPY